MSRTKTARSRREDIKKNYYVDGSTVRRLEGEPEERRRREQERARERRRREEHRAARENQRKAMRVNRGYVAFCTFALAVTCGVCVMYIHLQSEATSHLKKISALESQVTDLKTDNDATLKRIQTSSDLSAVKSTAMNELRMHYAGFNQIIYYTVKENDFMNQYSDVPTKDK